MTMVVLGIAIDRGLIKASMNRLCDSSWNMRI
jgi:hypothetical protein